MHHNISLSQAYIDFINTFIKAYMLKGFHLNNTNTIIIAILSRIILTEPLVGMTMN